VTQAKRQGEGGLAAYGSAILGVRVLPFGALHLTSLIHPERTRVLIAPTPTEPLARPVECHPQGGQSRASSGTSRPDANGPSHSPTSSSTPNGPATSSTSRR
jgi:hypothetical protein